MQIRPRSGLAITNGVTFLNSPGLLIAITEEKSQILFNSGMTNLNFSYNAGSGICKCSPGKFVLSTEHPKQRVDRRVLGLLG